MYRKRIFVFVFSMMLAAMGQAFAQETAPIVTRDVSGGDLLHSNSPHWKALMPSPDYYDNDPNSIRKYEGTSGAQYSRTGGPGINNPDGHPSYPKESKQIPDWAKAEKNRAYPDFIRMSLLRDEKDPDNKIILSIIGNEVIQSCDGPIKIEYTKTTKDKPFMDISMDGFFLNMKAPHGQRCNLTSSLPVAYIPLTREELENIKQIRLRTLYHVNNFNVVLGDNYVSLRPANEMKMIQFDPVAIGHASPMEQWFYPENTVILFVPGVSDNVNLDTKIRVYAGGRDLVPLKDVIKGFKPEKANLYYFVDKSGKFSKGLSTGNPVSIGALKATRNVQDVNGVVGLDAEYDLYARLPGYYD